MPSDSSLRSFRLEQQASGPRIALIVHASDAACLAGNPYKWRPRFSPFFSASGGWDSGRAVGNPEIGRKRGSRKLAGLVTRNRLVGSDLDAWHRLWTDYG